MFAVVLCLASVGADEAAVEVAAFGTRVFPGFLLDLSVLRILLRVLLPADPLYTDTLLTPHHLVQYRYFLWRQECCFVFELRWVVLLV